MFWTAFAQLPRVPSYLLDSYLGVRFEAPQCKKGATKHRSCFNAEGTQPAKNCLHVALTEGRKINMPI